MRPALPDTIDPGRTEALRVSTLWYSVSITMNMNIKVRVTVLTAVAAALASVFGGEIGLDLVR